MSRKAALRIAREYTERNDIVISDVVADPNISDVWCVKLGQESDGFPVLLVNTRTMEAMDEGFTDVWPPMVRR